MNIKQIQQDIRKGEGLHREFKEAKGSLPQNFFETVCAFLNTDGGTIFLGVADNGKVTGVDQDALPADRGAHGRLEALDGVGGHRFALGADFAARAAWGVLPVPGGDRNAGRTGECQHGHWLHAAL